MAYTTVVPGNDEAAKTVAKQNLDGLAERLALYFSDVIRNPLATDPLTDAITVHDDSAPGNRVEVVHAGGSRASFTVDRVERYPKRRFPTDDVYYPALTPRLRLVTCGGEFDRAAGSYRDNVIAFASRGP